MSTDIKVTIPPQETSEPTEEVTTSQESQILDLIDDSIDTTATEPTETPETKSTEVSGETESTKSIETSEPTEPTSTEPTPSPPLVEESPEVTTLKSQIAALTEQINKLSSSQSTPEPVKELDLGLQELIEKMDFDQIMDSKEAFTNFFTAALKAVSQATLGQAQEVVPQVISRQRSMEQVREDFYKSNPELNVVRPYVAQVANTIATAHPDWKVEQVLAEAAKISKTSLGITSVVVPPTSTAKTKDSKTPTLPGGSGGTRKPAVQGSKMQSQIDELLDD